MKTSKSTDQSITVTLEDMLRMERYAHLFDLKNNRRKIKTLLGGRHSSSMKGRGLDFEEVRNYVKGDDIRNIDWKVTARTQKTHTRVFVEEKEKPALIVVDQSKSMFFGSTYKTKAQIAAELAALISFKVVKQGDRVGGMVFADQAVDIVYPKRDRRNILRFFHQIKTRNEELLLSEPINFQESLKEAIQKVRNLVSHDFSVFFISDFYRYSEDVLKFLVETARKNDVTLLQVTDPMERDIPQQYWIAGNDQHQVEVKGQQKETSKAFQNHFDEARDAFNRNLQKHRIPLLSFTTSAPIEEQLKDFFRSTGK